MREIIFRAKRLDNGEWAESGSITKNKHDDGREEWFIGARNPADQWTDERGNMVAVETLGDCLFYACDPETIGQFTGMADKNGKGIFEGDIIKIPDDYDEFGINAGEVYEVYFAFGGFRLKPKRSKAKGFWLEDDKTVEIIGNIHDNPELLEVNHV